MLRMLLIDTCGSEGSVALASQSEIVASETLPGRSASERLVAVVRGMVHTQGWKLRELAAIVVVHGPGSFTGVRVGLSAAKGLSEASEVPVVAVSRLAVLAAAAGEVEGEVCAVLDAGREEFYCGVYVGQRCVREALMTEAEVREVAAGCEAVVVCEVKVAETLRELEPRLVGEPVAGDALPFAVKRVVAGEFDDVATLDANYLRRSDSLFAKPKGEPAR
jgi:tRNA threonylcarbamoyladenosine biosynthesis protein TsaB